MINFFKSKIVVTILIVTLLASVALGGILLITTHEKSDKIVIYTSIYPLYDFTKKIGGDKVEVINIVKAGEEAHHYEPTAKQISQLEDSDLIIINGLNMESWTNKLSHNLSKKIVNASNGAKLLTKTGELHLPEENGDDNNNNYESEYFSDAYDPHVWLSIKNAIIQMENIKNALVSFDTKNADYYESNFETYKLLFNALDKEFEHSLSIYENNVFVVSHKAFGYLAHEYNLVQKSLNGIDTEGEPLPATMAGIIDFINDTTNNVKAVFYQTLTNSKVAQNIASQTNAKIGILSTIESLTISEIEAGADYLSIMAKNLTELIRAFSTN